MDNFFRVDNAFRDKISQIGKNPLADKISRVVRTLTYSMRYETVATMLNSGRGEELVAAHSRLYETLKNPDLNNVNEIVKESYFGEALQGEQDLSVRFLVFGVRKFVPNISFGIPVLKSIHKAMPDVFFDVHLMISHPIDYFQAFADAGAGLINLHIESASDPWATLRKIQQAGCKTGMTVKPATPVETVHPYLDQMDLVLIMSVEPEFGGQNFMTSALGKVSRLAEERKQRGLRFLIELNGGINTETERESMEVGADVLVAGSTVFGAENITEACRELLALSSGN